MPPISHRRVLIADDLETNRFLLTEAIAEIGVEVLIADTGKRALEIASASSPEVALIDFQMPDVSGAEVARRIKTVGEVFTYVILTSGYHESEASPLIRASTADRFLAKPYRLDDLRQAIEDGLRITHEKRNDHRRDK